MRRLVEKPSYSVSSPTKYMNTFKIAVSLFLITASQWCLAQEYVPYDWDENRATTSLNEIESSFPLFYILQSEQRQFVYEDGNLICYITNHEIVRATNDEALSKINRIYIPMYNTMDVVAIQARAITKDGRKINFDQQNIKTLEEDQSGYKIFAIEGAEVGGEVEYFYTRKTYNDNFFTRTFQYEYPVKNFKYELTSPDNLEYEFKVYNHDGKVQTDTTKDLNRYYFEATNIDDLQREEFSAYDNSRYRIEARLAYNSIAGTGRLMTWGDAGKRLYDQVYDRSKAEQKVLSKFIKKLDLSGTPIEALKRTEHYLKTTFYFKERVSDDENTLYSVIKNQYASSRGFTRLYVAILEHLNIKHELVLSSDRMTKAFDATFDTWSYLDDYMIYINEADQFISPKDIAFRMGTIPSEYIGNKALFIRAEDVQNFKYPVAYIGDIPEPSYQDNFDNLSLDVVFSNDLESNEVKLIRAFKGYSASYYKAVAPVLDEFGKQEMIEDAIKYLASDAKIDYAKISEENSSFSTWNKPFIIESKFTTQNYIESAGDIVLFKVGDLIGAQSELYQEKQRKTPIVNTFNRGYLRTIQVVIPDGYQVQNPDDIIIKEQVEEAGKLIYNFTSSYTLSDKLLNIEIVEYYDQLHYPISKFEPFRRVINAAADWNKIVLVLKPE